MEDKKAFQYIRFIKQDPETIKKIPKEILIQYPQLCFEAINTDPSSIRYIPMEIREANAELCIEAVKKDPETIKYIPEQVQIDNPQMCVGVVKNSKGLLYYISIDVLEQNPEVSLEALLRDRDCLEDIPEEAIEENLSIKAMLDIMENWENINNLPEKLLRENPQLCIMATLKSDHKYMPPEQLLEGNRDLVDKYIKEWGIDGSTATELIIATKDTEFIKECIKNKEQYDLQDYEASEFETSEIDNLYRLIDSIGENPQDEIKKIIERKDEFNLSNTEIAQIISKTQDPDFMKSIIEEREKYGFNLEDIECLIPETKDISYILTYVRENKLNDPSKQKKIKLPENMTIGIEIESEGKLSKPLLEKGEIIKDWKAEEEGSIDNGVEIISPVLKSGESRENEIYEVCTALKLAGHTISDECGGHIHIGADYLKDINSWKNLIELWSNTENILYIIGNKEGETPRSTVNEYAPPISQDIGKSIESGEIDLKNEDDLEKLCGMMIKIQKQSSYESRYSGINFENIGDEGKNTIEFRISNGTIDPEVWIENINLFGGIVVASQELSEIQKKIEEGMTISEEEQNKINMFEKIKELENVEANEKQKLECLLGLTIPKEDREVYFKRYKTNREKMKYTNIVEGVKPIKISKKKLGKIAFTGDERVTGTEYQQTSQIIQNELEHEQENSMGYTISE